MSIRTPGHRPAADAARARRRRARRDAAPAAARRVRRPGRAARSSSAVSIAAAAARGDALDHVLLAGPPGLGKTSLARIVAEELGVPFVQTAGPALERKGDIATFLTDLEPRAVFFVDEIHRLPRAVEETFYPAMEDRQLPVTLGVGPGAKVITLDLPPFTLIGATTRAGLLTTPLRDRFGIQHRLELYAPADLDPDRRPQRGRARRLDRRGRRPGDRRPRARHPARRQPAAQARPRLRRGARRRRGRRDGRRRRARPHGRRRASAWTGSTARSSTTICERSPAARSGSPRSRSPWPRSRTRSRTSTSRTCSSAASCSARPRGRCATVHAYRHLGLEPPAEPSALF